MRPIVVSILMVVACTGSPQSISGRVAPSFGNSVQTVQAKHGATILASSVLAPDGSFALAVPPSRDVTLQLVGSVRSDVVFPRHAGAMQRGFLVRGGGVPFALGTIRLQGTTTTFAFHDGSAATDCNDGKDTTGATCVDDSADPNDTCDADGSEAGDAHDDNGAEADASSTAPDAGDSTADHNFPSDGCSGSGSGGDR